MRKQLGEPPIAVADRSPNPGNRPTPGTRESPREPEDPGPPPEPEAQGPRRILSDSHGGALGVW